MHFFYADLIKCTSYVIFNYIKKVQFFLIGNEVIRVEVRLMCQ